MVALPSMLGWQAVTVCLTVSTLIVILTASMMYS
jgi:hypothetical protein